MSRSATKDSEPHRFAGILGDAVGWEVLRPTQHDIEWMSTVVQKRSGVQNGGRGRHAPKATERSTDSKLRNSLPDSTEKHGYWAPLLTAALGSQIQLPDKLKSLSANSAIDPENFARMLTVARRNDVAFEEASGKPAKTPSWDFLRSPSFSAAPAPLHAVLLALGATEAAANARSEAQASAFDAVRLGHFADKKTSAVQFLAQLQWFGADWMATDALKRTPLHLLCATASYKFTSGVLHTSAVAVLARFLCAQAPRSIFLEDVEGLTPLNYLVAPFRVQLSCIGSVHRELLLAVVSGLLSCRTLEPIALASALRESLSFTHAVQQAMQLVQSVCDVSALTGWAAASGLAGVCAWECAFTHWRLGLWQARDLFRASADLQMHVHTLRRVAGDANLSKTVVNESLAKQRLLENGRDWNVKQTEYEERLAQLEVELGRIESEQAAVEVDDIEKLKGKVRLVSVCDSQVASAPSQISTVYTLSVEALPPEDARNEQVFEKSAAVCEAEEVVARVRRSRLVDMDLEGMSEDARIGVASVRASLSAAVQRLAQDLYELESHFVMELVQNADDNKYSENAAEPPSFRLALHIPQEESESNSSQAAFFFSHNNENGLRTEDVVAMCDVNASSKRSQPGCTGHKGIGWKSTFAVSDCPYVLSGACTFKFDIAGPLGQLAYVTPTWVSPEELSQLPQVVLAAHAKGGTVIYLPLRTGAANAVAEGFRYLEEHHLSLLFFRRLRRLQLEYPTGRDVLLEHADKGTVAFQEQLPGQEKPRKAEYKYVLQQEAVVLPGGLTGNLTLAFPLTSSSSSECMEVNGEEMNGDREPEPMEQEVKQAAGDSSLQETNFTPPGAKEQLRPQALYVSLPVRLTGFCFAIDGPFDLIASRGELHEGSAVNQALCDAVPVVFAAALQDHAAEIGPRALMLIGDMPTQGHWRRVRRQLLVVLNSISCIPTEDGELALPSECVERPQSPSAEAASQLIPPELLLFSCGKRFARSTRAAGSLRGVTVSPLGLAEWLHVFRYRGALWPYGLVGAALREGNAASFFRTLYTWLDEEVRLAECASALLQQIWDIELFPSAAPGHTLMRLSDGPIFECMCDNLPRKWQQVLVDDGVLRIFDPSVWSALQGYPGSSFLSEVATTKITRSAIAAICIEWHLLRFRSASLEVANSDAIWASLACLMEAFLAEDIIAQSSTVSYLPLQPLEAGATLDEQLLWWRDLGNLLWIPTLGGVDRNSPPAARAPELACASYLGVPGAPDHDVHHKIKSSETRSLLCHGDGREFHNQRHCSVAYDYCRTSSLSKTIRWETFLDALGIVALKPSLNGTNTSVSGNLIRQLGACLLSEKWWSEAMKDPHVLRYVCRRIHCASQAELAWLQALPVKAAGDVLPRCVSSHFLYDVFVQLGGCSLPYVRLPPATESSMEALRHARSALAQLGVQTTKSGQSLLRCLSVLRADGSCSDIEVYADFYKEVSSLDVSEWGEGDLLEVREALAELVYVPDHGFMKALDCTWEDDGVMQWLTEVPSLSAHYERYGPTLRHFFLGVVRTPQHLTGFAPHVFVHALRRLVKQVELACQNRDATLPGAPISARALLDDLRSIVMQVYERLAKCCEGACIAEHTAVRSAFNKERLLMLVYAGRDHPKRLYVAEAWWDVEAELSGTKVADLAFSRCYGHIPGAEAFFLRVLGVRRRLTRSDLAQRARLPPLPAAPLSHWDDGVNMGDLEDFVPIQISEDFRPSNLRGADDEEDNEQQNENQDRAGQNNQSADSRSSQPLHPARHPPAWRSREALERQQAAEQARKAEEDRNAEEERRRARERWQRENPRFMVDRQRARGGRANADAGDAAANSDRSSAAGGDAAAAHQDARGGQAEDTANAAAAAAALRGIAAHIARSEGRQRIEAPNAASSKAAPRPQRSEAPRAARQARQQAEATQDAQEVPQDARDAPRDDQAGDADAEQSGEQDRYLQRLQDRLNRAQEARSEARAAERLERERQSAQRRRAWEQYRDAHRTQDEEAEDGHQAPEQRAAPERRSATQQTNDVSPNDAASMEEMLDVQPEHGRQTSDTEDTFEDNAAEPYSVENVDGSEAEGYMYITMEEVQLMEIQIVELTREAEEKQNYVQVLLEEKSGIDQACEQYIRMIQSFYESSE